MRHEGVHELFSATAQACQSRIAIDRGGACTTFGELDDASNILANLIISSGTPKGSIIAILSDDSTVNIVGMIGILKAGCAFAPLDPKIPHKRLQAIISELSPEWFVGELRFFETLRTVVAERASKPR